jgi:hypothetical protein
MLYMFYASCSIALTLTPWTRLRNHEHWRKEFGADNLVKNFKFAEANALGGYIRQFHHKTDIVRLLRRGHLWSKLLTLPRCIGWKTCLYYSGGKP